MPCNRVQGGEAESPAAAMITAKRDRSIDRSQQMSAAGWCVACTKQRNRQPPQQQRRQRHERSHERDTHPMGVIESHRYVHKCVFPISCCPSSDFHRLLFYRLVFRVRMVLVFLFFIECHRIYIAIRWSRAQDQDFSRGRGASETRSAAKEKKEIRIKRTDIFIHMLLGVDCNRNIYFNSQAVFFTIIIVMVGWLACIHPSIHQEFEMWRISSMGSQARGPHVSGRSWCSCL